MEQNTENIKLNEFIVAKISGCNYNTDNGAILQNVRTK